jgi:RNA polymerase sigma-70 factor (ECF subfamily)
MDALNHLNAKEILALIQTLPQGYRITFNLFAIEGFSHKEIAEKLQISESTSKSQVRNARFWLMKKLNSNYD